MGPSKTPILFAVCLAALVLPLSFSGGAVATPAIGAAFGGGATAMNWVTNAFMLTFGSGLMAAGALADQFGRKRVFLAGIMAFAAFSIALSLAPSLLALNVLRAGQGVAAAAALAGGTAALAQEFQGRARTQAFSLLGATFGLGLAFGPLLAGFLITRCGWRSVFLSAAIVGAVSALLAGKRMRESRDPNAAGLDIPGALTFTGALALFTFGVIQAPEAGWGSPVVVGALLGSAVTLAAFVFVETHTRRPMLDLSLFRYPRFVGVQVLPIATCYGYVVLLVLLPLRFIGVAGLDAMQAGLLLIALSAPMLVVPLAAAALTRWLSAGHLCAGGLTLAAVGLFFLGRARPEACDISIIAPMLLIGLGAGAPWGLMDGLSVSVVPKDRAGMAAGIFGTTRVAGEGVALAVVNALLSGLVEAGLTRLAPRSDGTLAAAAHRLALGDLRGASDLLPTLALTELRASYATSFERLSLALMGVTLVSALAIFLLLGDPMDEADAATASPETDF